MADIGRKPATGAKLTMDLNVSGIMRAGLVIATTLMLPVTSLSAADVKWPAGPYKYIVIDQDVKDALTEFGRNVNLPVAVSDQVKGRVRGRLPIGTAEEFLTGLCDSYGLVWYFDGSMLHVNAMTELRTELIEVGRAPALELVNKLGKQGLGIEDPRYVVKATTDAGIISVSGPPPYISLVRQTLIALARGVMPQRAREDGVEEVRVRVFRGG
jgi:type II secretory pathway component GspD/PulD (secretin)